MKNIFNQLVTIFNTIKFVLKGEPKALKQKIILFFSILNYRKKNKLIIEQSIKIERDINFKNKECENFFSCYYND